MPSVLTLKRALAVVALFLTLAACNQTRTPANLEAALLPNGVAYVARATCPMRILAPEPVTATGARTFKNELMTGFISTGSDRLSRLSNASLGDLGYAINLAADAYSLSGALSAQNEAKFEVGEVLLTPDYRAR